MKKLLKNILELKKYMHFIDRFCRTFLNIFTFLPKSYKPLEAILIKQLNNKLFEMKNNIFKVINN